MRATAALVLLACAACTRPAPPAPPAHGPECLWAGMERPAGCRLVLAEEVAAQLVEVTRDAAVRALGPCPVRAACVDGAPGVRVRVVDGEGLVAELAGSAPFAVTRGAPAFGGVFPGIVVGPGVLVTAPLDAPDVLRVFDVRTPAGRDVARPILAPVERAARVVRDDDVLALKIHAGARGDPDGTRYAALDGAPLPADGFEGRVRGVGAPAGRLLAREGRLSYDDGARPAPLPLATAPGPAVAAVRHGAWLHVFVNDAPAGLPSSLEVHELTTGETWRRAVDPAWRLFPTASGPAALDAGRGLVRLHADGVDVVRALDARRDLGGAPYPDGATRELLELVVDDTHALVFERLRLVTCELEDRVFLVDADTLTVTSLRQGRGFVRTRAPAGLDRLHFIEKEIVSRNLDDE